MNFPKKHSQHDAYKEDVPPYSKIFIVCDKRLRDSDLRPAFEQFGTIESLYMPRNANTGASNGVAYVKYAKTSSAANAIKEMHKKTINSDTKPLKVMIATVKTDKHQNTSEDKYTRLFIKVPREESEHEIKQHFESFGQVESVFIQRDKFTDKSKGFAYVKYNNFYEAAKAFEDCDRKYKAVFAEPRDELKRSRNSLETNNFNSGIQDRSVEPYRQPRIDNDVISLISTNPQSYNSVAVTCSPIVSQKYIEDLFNIIPGMTQFQYSADNFNSICRATVMYQEEKAAAYAVERLNNFEFPSGEHISVKPNDNPLAKAANNLADIINTFKNGIDSSNPNLSMLAEAIAQASSIIKVVATGKSEMKVEAPKYSCNVDLPPPEPMASNEKEVALELFIVCKPQPPPMSILKDVFCRFGDLIHISTFPNKTFGFVRYASRKSAVKAIRVLDGAMIAGVHFKVMEAMNRHSNDEDVNMNNDAETVDNEDHNTKSKRMRMDEDSKAEFMT